MTVAVHLVVKRFQPEGNLVGADMLEVPGDALPDDISADRVIFAVRSELPERSETLAATVRTVFNRWCLCHAPAGAEVPGVTVRRFNDDEPHFEDYTGPDVHYVYAYAYKAPNGWHRDHIFYVGMGVKNRYLDHLRRPTEGDAGETRKRERIRAALGEPASWPGREAEIVRHVAVFNGALAPMQAAAVEHFLITHHIGVYRLTNRTGGNDRHGAEPDRWMALPQGVTEFDEWNGLLHKLISGHEPADAQALQKRLTARAIGAQVVAWRLGDDVVNGLRSMIRADPLGDLFISDGTDVSCQYLLKYHGQSVMRVQLKMSDTDPAFRINLRPLDTAAAKQDFAQLIANMFFGGNVQVAQTCIRNRGAPYFKPCAPSGDGARDIDFYFSDIAKPYMLRDVPLSLQNPWEATLLDIFKAIVSRVPEVTVADLR